MSSTGRSKVLFIVFLMIVLIPLGYAGLQFYSMKSATKSISNPRIDISITDLLNIQSTLIDILLEGELDGEFDLVFEGHGFIPTTVKSIQAKIFLEDVYVGSFVSNDFFTIPASGIETAHMDFSIDLNQIGISELEQIMDSILEHNGEMKISIDSLIEPVIIVFPITVPVTDTDYILTYSDAPQVVSLGWAVLGCEIGDEACFFCTVENVFRESEVSGIVDILVREDVSWGSDTTADVFSYPVRLGAGETATFTDQFSTYKESATRGFFLKTLWGSSIIQEQPSQYPPRLEVFEGSLTIDEVYWTVGVNRVTSCEKGDVVRAHVQVRAMNAALEDDVVVKIRKDVAFLPDSDDTINNFHIELEKDETRDLIVAFSPNEVSGIGVRGYFVEVEGDLSWTMPDEYPPRLEVHSQEEMQGELSVSNVWWTKGAETVTSVDYGDEVDAKISVRAINGDFTGIITVLIRRDLAFTPDTNLATQSYSISLSEGEVKTLTVPFVASEASSSSFRGYFIEIEGDILWTMSNSYPPRLTVDEPAVIPETYGNPIVQNAWWTYEGGSITQASQGQSVTAVVRLKSIGGISDGIVSVHVRKDIAFLPDEDLLVYSYEIYLEDNELVDIEIDFTAIDKSGFTFRGYFIQVDLVSWSDVWTMGDTYPPRLEVS